MVKKPDTPFKMQLVKLHENPSSYIKDRKIELESEKNIKFENCVTINLTFKI